LSESAEPDPTSRIAMDTEAALVRDTPRNWFAAIGPSIVKGLLVAAAGAADMANCPIWAVSSAG
jgi:hypothetical protein